jgi:hypothetical protein
MFQIGATGLNFSTGPVEVTLAGAQAHILPPGNILADIGRYTTLEIYDSNMGFWRNTGNIAGTRLVNSDGTNYRLINRTGCPMGAIITSAGTGYTSAPTCTASSGGSVWKVIVGGAINTTVTVTTGGAYNYVPSIIFDQPPAGGVRATGYAVIAAGAISSVTVTNRGAGYVTAPTITIVQDPRDTAAGGGVLTVNATLSTSTVPTAVICTDPGSIAQTTLPTLSFTGGGGSNLAATVVMNWTATGITVVTGGAVYGNAQPFSVQGAGLRSQATAVSGDAEPAIGVELIKPRNFLMEGTSTSAGAITATGLVIDDAGFGIQRVPDAIVLVGGSGLPTTTATATVTVGATVDTSYYQFIRV